MAQDWLKSPLALRGKRVWVAGHSGMVGAALVRRLEREGCTVLTAGRESVDLRRPDETLNWLLRQRPDMAIVAAARVGGILANQNAPADFLYDNMMIAANAIHGAFRAGVKRLLFLGSSCIYPRDAAQPIAEDALMTGPLEATNEAYAVAKIAGLKLCEAYRRQHGCDFFAAMPCNLYGPGDNFDAQTGHVIGALMGRMEEARRQNSARFSVWGTGTPRREFLYVDDAADALVFLLQRYCGAGPVNVGAGEDLPIASLARTIARVVGYKGELVFDTSRPDGTPRKLMDSSRLYSAGWRPRVVLDQGLEQTYRAYLLREESIRHAA